MNKEKESNLLGFILFPFTFVAALLNPFAYAYVFQDAWVIFGQQDYGYWFWFAVSLIGLAILDRKEILKNVTFANDESLRRSFNDQMGIGLFAYGITPWVLWVYTHLVAWLFM